VTKGTISVKTAKTIKEYRRRYHGWDLVVPAGSLVTNQTACGPSDSYHFWRDWNKIAEELTGFKNSILAHDLTYYGLNIPAEYCEPYKEDAR